MIKRASHAVYELKYHFVWIPKARKQVLEGAVRERLKELIKEICNGYGWEMIEQEIQRDHVHVFISAPSRYGASEIIQAMKSITARKLFEEFPSLREKMISGEMWSDGYFVRGVGERVTSEIIRRYIKYQEKYEDGKQPLNSFHCEISV